MFRHFLWDMTGKVSGYIISLVTSVLLSRLLLPEDFGILAIAQIFALLVSVVMEMGLSSAVIQRPELSREEVNAIYTVNIGVVAVLTIALFFGSFGMARFYSNSSVGIAVRIVCVQLVFSGLSVIPTALMYREQKFRAIMAASTVSALSGSAVAVIMALRGAGFYSLVMQSVVTSVVQFVILQSVVSYRPKISLQISKAKDMMSFSAKIFLSTVLNQVFQKADVLIFGKTYPMATLGYYNRAIGLDNILRGFSSSSILNVLLPKFSRIQKDRELVNQIYNKTLHLLCFSFFLIAGMLFLFSKEVIIVLFGQKWVESEALLRLILLSSFAYPVSSLMLSVVEGSGHANLFLRLEMVKKFFALPFLIMPFFMPLKTYLAWLVLLSYVNVVVNAAGLAKISGVRVWETMRVILIYNIEICFAVGISAWVLSKFNLNILVTVIFGSGMLLGIYFLLNRLFRTQGLSHFISDIVGKLANKRPNF